MPMSKQQQDEYKLAKQRLSSIQKLIKQALKDDRLPQTDDAARFIAASKEVEQLSYHTWKTAMDDYMKRLAQFQTAMEGRDLSKIKDAFQGLLDCKISCHKAFRQR